MEMTPVNIDSRKSLDLRAGDNVRVYQKIQDKSGKTRLQVFEGMVLARKHGTEAGATFTVRRSTGGYGVEKIFPLYSPMIDKIEITKRSKVKRSKLYYIREKALKQISKRMRMMFVDIKTSEDLPEESKKEDEGEVESKEETEEVTKEENKIEEKEEEPEKKPEEATEEKKEEISEESEK